MADARALLRAKRQEARITHPYAAYSQTGQLRCTACGAAVKQASMWEGHIGSKAHRVSVTKMRQREEAQRAEEEERTREELTLRVQGKRKADDEDGHDVKKRRVSDEEDEADEDTQQGAPASRGAFPADFFSDPSRTVPQGDDEREEEEHPSTTTNSALDLEWEQFKATVISAPETEKEEDRRDAFARATVFAEPELAPAVPEGFPMEEVATADVPEETEQEKRKRREQEDRELIMDRLMEEERAQEEADSRVDLLKSKLEAVKKARMARKAGKAK